MSPAVIRILLLADTHLGFDSPQRPRVKRRRRGPDFFACYEHALRPARQGEVDLVVHGGDLLFRRRVAPVIVGRALTPLAEIARSGVPVFLVPGNHEGSRIPFHLAAATPGLQIFHQPETVIMEIRGIRVGLSGFPFARRIDQRFEQLLVESGYAAAEVNCHLLCIHQSVEGATVGVQNFAFRPGPDVIAGRAIPAAFDAVLAGHIHRSQLLTHDLSGHPLPAPVIYPGSIERTSFAERLEVKQYALVTMRRQTGSAGFEVKVVFEDLPTRPMVVLSIESGQLGPAEFIASLRREIAALDPDSVVQVRLSEPISKALASVINATTLRSLAPSTMNIALAARQPGGQPRSPAASR